MLLPLPELPSSNSNIGKKSMIYFTYTKHTIAIRRSSKLPGIHSQPMKLPPWLIDATLQYIIILDIKRQCILMVIWNVFKQLFHTLTLLLDRIHNNKSCGDPDPECCLNHLLPRKLTLIEYCTTLNVFFLTI